MSKSDDLAMALFHTVEYVGLDILPPIEGWSWFDAMAKHRPDLLADITKHHSSGRPKAPEESVEETTRV